MKQMKVKHILLASLLFATVMAKAQVANFGVTNTLLGDTNSSASGNVTLGGGSNFTATYNVTLANASALTNTVLSETNTANIVVANLTNGIANSITGTQYSNLVSQGAVLTFQTTNGDLTVSLNFPKPALTGIKFDKLVPKDGKKISFKVDKGFKAKGRVIRTDAAATNSFTGDVYAFFQSGTGTNLNTTAPVKLTQKETVPKQLAKKGVLAIFKADKTSGRVGINAQPVAKDAAVSVIFFASNSSGVLYQTNALTAKNIK